MELQEFKIFLEKYKSFRELPKQYKSIKFCKLYYKMYNYIISIPKEKIIIMKIVQRNNYVQYLFNYIYKFIEAKDFYNWKERIYSLVTRKINPKQYEHYILLYGSKAKYFYNIMQEKTNKTLEKKYGPGITNVFQVEKIKEKSKSTIINNLGIDHPMHSKKVVNKIKKNWQNKTKEEIDNIVNKRESTNLKRYKKKSYTQTEEYKEKSKDTCMKNYGVEYASQSNNHKEKSKTTWKNKTKEEIDNIVNKRKSTNLKRYKKSNKGGWMDIGGGHSKEADEFCKLLDTLYGTLNTNDTKYFTKNGELYFKTSNGYIRFYDFMNIKEKWGVEYDCIYWHALDKNPDDVIIYPGGKTKLAKEIWQYDKEKEELAEKNGYKIFHIRDNEYKSNKSKCLENLLKEIENYVHSQENVL